MISGKTVHDVHVIPKSLLVFSGLQWRSHLATAFTNYFIVISAQEQMMWGNFTGHWNTHVFCSFDDHDLKIKETLEI